MADPGMEMQQTAHPSQPGYGQPGGPPGGQPGYGQAPPPAYPANTNTTVIIQAPPAKPSNYMALAIVTTICCNLIFGIIAIIFSVMSSSAADDGDMEGAKTKGKCSMAFSIVGILSTILAIVIVIVYFVVIVKQVTDAAAAATYSIG